VEDPERVRLPGEAATMDEYPARARWIYGGWEVTFAGLPAATFRHRDPTDEVIHEHLIALLGRTDFRVRLVRDDTGRDS
jgi:hypothetical protein